jgi:hypothetical protein
MPELQKPKPRVRRAPARQRPKLTMEDLEVCSACWLQQAACGITGRRAQSAIDCISSISTYACICAAWLSAAC